MATMTADVRVEGATPPRARNAAAGGEREAPRFFSPTDRDLPWTMRATVRRKQMGKGGWTLDRLAEQMRIVATRHGIGELPKTLPNMLCRWLRGRKVPSTMYQHLLAEALGVTAWDLGLPVDPLSSEWEYGGVKRAEQ